MAKRKSKRARTAEKPDKRKQPRVPWFESVEDQKPLWSFVLLDLGGPWCFGHIRGNQLVRVLGRLRSFESMTWTEIEQGTGSHFVACDQIISEAHKRLEQLRLDDIERLFSLRMEGKPRIWGIRVGNILRIIWWDAEHKIYHSEKR